MIVNLTRAAQHKATSRIEGANRLQFSLRAEVYLQIIWKAAISVRAIGNRQESWHHFKMLVSCKYSHTRCLLAVVSHLDELG